MCKYKYIYIYIVSILWEASQDIQVDDGKTRLKTGHELQTLHSLVPQRRSQSSLWKIIQKCQCLWAKMKKMIHDY